MTDIKQHRLTDAQIEDHCRSADPLVSRLAAELKELREAVRQHRSQTGHALCWLNDVELWRHIETDPQYPHATLPVREEFLANCERFYRSRLQATAWDDPPVQRHLTDPDDGG